MKHFKKSIEIKCSVERAFDFHKDTNNLKLITPPGISVKILSIELPLKLGSEIVLNVTQFGLIRNKWHIKLTEFVENKLITDTQIKGPFALWKHKHIFEDKGETTLMTDEIEFKLPFGILGDIAYSVFVARLIRNQFEYRQRVTKQILESRSQ
ncbi:MAG: SRPBCC family protein [Ignavibacteria bacterium]|nr:SRPBCC family protein [Ignavibacteria bacterium]